MGLITPGMAPGQSMLGSSRRTALIKPDGGYRPIAVGGTSPPTVHQGNSAPLFSTDFLLPVQFGVGTKGEVTSVIRAAQRALDGSLGRSATHLTSLDFSNALNTVTLWIERKLPQDCAASLPVSIEQAVGPTAHPQTASWTARKRGFTPLLGRLPEGDIMSPSPDREELVMTVSSRGELTRLLGCKPRSGMGRGSVWVTGVKEKSYDPPES